MFNYTDGNKIKDNILSKNKNVNINELNNIINILLYAELMIHTTDEEYWVIIFSDMMEQIYGLTR